MSARSKARKRALDILYQADLTEVPVEEVYHAERERAQKQPERERSWQYAREIVLGYIEYEEVINETITSYSVEWPIHRMPRIDRNILRIAIWEILHNPEVTKAVAISEAVLLAKEYSTEDSFRFINGILAKVAA